MSKKKRSMSKSGKIRIVIMSAAIIILLLLLVFYFKSCRSNKDGDEKTTGVFTTIPQEELIINPLTGLKGLDKSAVDKRPIAIMVENHPDARPQWGYSSPDIIVEGLAEGGITRMMWLYSDVNSIPKIGPVRSARHDFIEISEGLDAIFVHWGGSPYAYDMIENEPYVDNIDGMKLSGTYFFRDKSRGVAMEHTGYTNGESIAKAMIKLSYRDTIKAVYKFPFHFADEKSPRTLSGGSCSSITASFSGPYTYTFKYNTQNGLFYRHLNNNKVLDDSGNHVNFENVIVLYMPFKYMGSSSNVIDMDLTGGQGVYASNGTYENITWKKGNSSGNMLKLYNQSGEELTLNAGKSWIGFVPTGRMSNTKISSDPLEGMQS